MIGIKINRAEVGEDYRAAQSLAIKRASKLGKSLMLVKARALPKAWVFRFTERA